MSLIVAKDKINGSSGEHVVLLTLGLKPWVNIFPIAEFPMVAKLRLTCGNVGGISNVSTVSVLCGEAKTITVGFQIVIF